MLAIPGPRSDTNEVTHFYSSVDYIYLFHSELFSADALRTMSIQRQWQESVKQPIKWGGVGSLNNTPSIVSMLPGITKRVELNSLCWLQSPFCQT